MSASSMPPVSEMSLGDIAELIDQLVEQSDVLEAPHLAFLLALAGEDARLAAGLPAKKLCSFDQAYTPTADTLDSVGEFELE